MAKEKIGDPSDPYNSLSCPWNGPDSNLRSIYNENRLLASIPVYQHSVVLPPSCYNTDSGPNSYYHVPLDNVSFQFGRSKLYDSWFNVWFSARENTYVSQRVSFNTPPGRANKTGRKYYDTSIPNPPNNITRLFYSSTQVDGIQDSLDLGTMRAMVDNVNGVRVQEDEETSGFPYQVPIFDATKQADFPAGTTSNAPRFKGQQESALSTEPLFNIDNLFNQIGYFHKYTYNNKETGNARFTVNYQAALSLTVPNLDTLPFNIPGCDRQGCLFQVSVTMCASSTIQRYSVTEFGNRFSYPTGAADTTGCGILSSHLYKIQADPGYRKECCLQDFTPEMLSPDSITILDQFIYGLTTTSEGITTSYSGEIVGQEFSPSQVYCDPSWLPGNPSCDIELQTVCGFSLSTDTDGKVRNSTVVPGTACQAWYASVMKSLVENGFTRRNFDVINDFITRYCALNASTDPDSCACVTGFNPRNDGYWGYSNNQSVSLLATPHPIPSDPFSGVFFTDPLCSSVQCRVDPDYFTIDQGANPPKKGPQVLISPSIVFAKKQCPAGMCFVINEGSVVNATQVQTRQQVDIANTDFMCTLGDGSFPPPVQIEFDVLIKSRDRRGDIVGQFNYDPDTGFLQDGAAIINISFVFPELLETLVPEDATFEIIYGTDEISQASYFQFGATTGFFPLVTPRNSDFSLPALVPKINQQVCTPKCYGTYFDTQTVTVLFTAYNVEVRKQFIVRVLMYPTVPRPPNTTNTQEQVFNSPVEIPKPSISRTTMAVLFLCGVLVFYSIIFLLEVAEISTIRGKIVQQFSPPPP